ncbi:hypothetical protein C8J56DRAFT_902781 [Mycena floridula]|nr:hypothetical protein C8J56DRAFT_902781 [Mycena floridula]
MFMLEATLRQEPDLPDLMATIAVATAYEALFVNEKVKVVFSIRALDPRFNIFLVVPDYIALLDVNDIDAPQVLMYHVQRLGYLLLAAVELCSVHERVIKTLERDRINGALTDREKPERLWSYWSQDWFRQQGQVFAGASETVSWEQDYDNRVWDKCLASHLAWWAGTRRP